MQNAQVHGQIVGQGSIRGLLDLPLGGPDAVFRGRITEEPADVVEIDQIGNYLSHATFLYGNRARLYKARDKPEDLGLTFCAYSPAEGIHVLISDHIRAFDVGAGDFGIDVCEEVAHLVEAEGRIRVRQFHAVVLEFALQFLGSDAHAYSLEEVEGGLGVRIYQARDRAIPEAEAAAINVQFDGGLPTRGAILGAPVDWDSRFVIELYVRTTTETPDAGVDPLLIAVYREMASDPSLGGLTTDIGEPVIEAEYSSEGKKTGWIRMTYPVQHRTQNMTLE